MVTKTIGVGGDYSDFGSAYAALPATLSSDYTFRVISNFTEATGIVNDRHTLMGNYTITFIDPNRDHVITITTKGYGPRDNIAVSSSGTLVFENLTLNCTTNTLLICFYPSPWVGGSGLTLWFKSITIFGYKSGVNYYTTGIGFYIWGSIYRVINCKFYNCLTGLNHTTEINTTGTNHLIENCSFYGCSTSIRLPYITTATRNFTFRNCVSAASVVAGFENHADVGYNVITNCADSDGSIATSGCVLSGNITGIADIDFLSVVPTSTNFLKLNQIFSLSTSKSLVTIKEDVVFSTPVSGSSKLWKTGTTSISSWNTSDILGNPRPNNEGSVCVGAYEKEAPYYLWDLDDGLTSTDASPTISYSVSGVKNISVLLIFKDGSTSTLTGTITVTGYNLDFIGDNLSGPVKLKTKFSVIFEP